MSQAHRAYFNQLATLWENSNQDQFERYLNQFGIGKGETILDVGAGSGCLTQHLLTHVKKDGTVIAIDLSEQMLFKAHKCTKMSNAFFVCSDAAFLALKHSLCDKIICFSAFPHFDKPLQALQEFYRILKPQGKLLIFHTSCSRKLNHYHAKQHNVVYFDKLPKSEKLGMMLDDIGFQHIKALEKPHLYWVEGEK